MLLVILLLFKPRTIMIRALRAINTTSAHHPTPIRCPFLPLELAQTRRGRRWIHTSSIHQSSHFLSFPPLLDLCAHRARKASPTASKGLTFNAKDAARCFAAPMDPKRRIMLDSIFLFRPNNVRQGDEAAPLLPSFLPSLLAWLSFYCNSFARCAPAR